MSETIAKRNRISVYLAGEFFTSRAAITERVADVLEDYENGAKLKGNDYALMRELIDKHPRALFIVGCGISEIRAYQQPSQGRGRAFAKSLRVTRFDGSVIPVGFRNVILGRTPCLKMFTKAAEQAVEQQLELFSRKAFKASTSQVWCPIEKTWISCRAHAVEYSGDNLAALIGNYVAMKQLHLASIRYHRDEYHEDRISFADPDDRREWQNWHRQHAQLRIVKREQLQSVAS